MSLTDLELCKRIAEIEGVDTWAEDGKTYYRLESSLRLEYIPLTNKALLMDLILKYKVCIDRGFAGTDEGLVEIWPDDIDTCSLIGTYAESFDNDDEFPRSALLVIIQANN